MLTVLILLALRPCVIFLSAQFLSSQSGRHARIEYIDDDLAIENLAICRDALAHALGHLSDAGPGIVPRPVRIEWTPKFSRLLSCRVPLRLARLPEPVPSGRAPPPPTA